MQTMPDKWFAWSRNVGATVDLTYSLTFQWELCGPASDLSSRGIRPFAFGIQGAAIGGLSSKRLVRLAILQWRGTGTMTLFEEPKVIRLGLMVFHSIHYYPWRRSLLYSPVEMVNTAIVTAPSLTARVSRSTSPHCSLPVRRDVFSGPASWVPPGHPSWFSFHCVLPVPSFSQACNIQYSLFLLLAGFLSDFSLLATTDFCNPPHPTSS